MNRRPSHVRVRGGAFLGLLFAFCVLLAALVLAWMLFLPVLIERRISQRTGFAVEMDGFSANPFSSELRVRGLKISNPEGFPEKKFISVSELSADFEFSSLWGERLVVNKLVLHVDELALVKDRQGRSNAELFQQRWQNGDEAQSSAAGAGDKTQSRSFLIRRLVLRVDRLLLVDGSTPVPTRREVDLHIDHSYDNVTSLLQVATPLAGKLSDTGTQLGDFAGKLGSHALEAAKKAGNAIKEVGRKVGEKAKDIYQSLKDKANR